MTTYIALLRGINVGGKNKIDMKELKAAFSDAGFSDVRTYINSGNVIFLSDKEESAVKTICEALITEKLGLDIPVCVISSTDLCEALSHRPDWWGIDSDSKHNAIFVIPPMTTAEVLTQIGEIKPEYEKLDYYGNLLFWSAPITTYSHTRLTKIVQNKSAYNVITIRNANTVFKLAELVKE